MGGYIASSRAWLIAPSMRVRPRSVSMVAATRSVTVYRESYHVWVSRCVPCVHVCAVLRLTHCIGSYVGCRGCGLHLVYSDTTRTTVKVVHSPSSPRATSHLPSRASKRGEVTPTRDARTSAHPHASLTSPGEPFPRSCNAREGCRVEPRARNSMQCRARRTGVLCSHACGVEEKCMWCGCLV